MSESVIKLVPSINIYAQIARIDPTRTLVLRNNFAAQMTARFRKLKAIIKTAIIDDDCFGIAKPESLGRRIVVQGGPGSGNFGHAGRPGAVGGSGGGGGEKVKAGAFSSVDKAQEYLDDKNNRDASLFNNYSDKWARDVDGSAKEFAYELARENYLLQEALHIEHFKSVMIPKEMTLYRVGPLYTGEGVAGSFWGNKQQAESYQKRMDVESIHKYKVSTEVVVPSRTGAGELWADIYEVREISIHSSPTTQADLTTRGGRSFDFPTSQEKSAAFLEWLKTQEQAGILETVRIPQAGTGIESAWTDMFIKDSYQRGVQRARDELLRGKYAVPSMEVTGGISASMMQPFHIDRLGSMYSRTFDGLKGISAQMDMQISHVLTKGLADGDSQATIAKKLLATIDGSGAGTLGITDSLGRFIPAERRAAMLARTEVIRAHAQGTLQEFKNWGVAGVNVLAEWITAGFNVCPECDRLASEGPYTIEQAWDMLPAHPNCRCAWLARPIDGTGKAPVEVAPEDIGDIESAINPVSAESLPSWGRVPTQDELSEVVSMADTLPDEYKSWIKNPQQVSLGIIDTEDRLAKISGGELWLRASDLKDVETMQHELRHLFVNPEVIKASGGAEKMWQEVMAADFRKPVHVNLMLSRTGERAAIDEFLAVMGDTYKSGMAKQEQVDLLIGGPKFRMTVEAERNSGQSGYFNAKVWTKPEADEAVSMWRNWMKISAPETPAAGVVEWKNVSSLADIIQSQKQFSEAIPGFEKISFINIERLTEREQRITLSYLNESGKQLVYLKNEFPGIVEIIEKDKNFLRKLEFGVSLRGEGVGGSYSSELDRIFMRSSGVGLKPVKEEVQRFGSWKIGDSYSSDFRHEVGHVCWNSSDRTMGSKISKEWQEIWESHNNKWWVKNVSKYGASEVEEAFAESFSAFTSQSYKKGKLPQVIESYFDKLLKRKSLTTQSKPQTNYHVITTHGGQGSGNFGHAGRPGAVGGSGGGGWKTSIDEGPAGWQAGKNDITRTDKGMIDPKLIIDIKGERGEHNLFKASSTGRYEQKDWNKLVQDIKENGVKHPVTIFKEKDGKVQIHEGNHRLRAAIEARVDKIPVEFRYFGNSQRSGLIIDPSSQ